MTSIVTERNYIEENLLYGSQELFSEADKGVCERTVKEIRKFKSSEIKSYIEKNAKSYLRMEQRAAYHACCYLVSIDESLGFEMGETLAATRLNSDDEEGVAYFSLLLNKLKPEVAPGLIDLAIDRAKIMFYSPEERSQLEALSFFTKLAEFGKTEDYQKIGPFAIEAYVLQESYAEPLFQAILLHEHRHTSILPFSLKVVVAGCSSIKPFVRGKSFFHFGTLLRANVVGSIPAAIEGVLQESQQETPRREIFTVLKELIENYSNGIEPQIEQALAHLSANAKNQIRKEAEALRNLFPD